VDTISWTSKCEESAPHLAGEPEQAGYGSDPPTSGIGEFEPLSARGSDVRKLE
jgi:hypothetical protein